MSWLLAFAGFAALIILHEFGHFLVAKRTGMRVERFFLFFPPKMVSVQRGETEYGVGWVPLGGFVKISGMNPEEKLPPEATGRGYYDQPVWKRVAVISAGPFMNLLVCFLILFVLAFGVRELTSDVGEVASGAPAAGKLQPGDELVSVDAKRGDAEVLARQINTHECPGKQTDGCRAATPAQVVVIRDGRTVALSIRPEYDADVDRQRLGFTYATRPLDPSVLEAADVSVTFMVDVTVRTLSVFARLLEPEQRDQLSGVVGGYEVTRQAIEFDARAALTLIALISLSLGIINLFPFLPLDGGHIFWSLVEKVRGRPVPFSVMERAGVVGFALVLLIFFIGLSNDIGRLTGEGFRTR